MSKNKKLKIGILGAGQLARMMILNSKHMGLEFVLFCEKMSSTTKNLAKHKEASVENKKALKEFCEEVDVVTFESENFEEELVDFVKGLKPLFPPKEALLIAQDRLKEKTLACELGIPTNKFRPIENYEELLSASKDLGFPLILKARRFGYDGKHQYHIQTEKELTALKNENFRGFLAESFVPFSHEVSIVGVRDQNSQIKFYDLCRNEHKQGVLRETKNIKDEKLFSEAKEYLTKIMKYLDYVGILTLEFFVLDGKLIFNEMAPRVHNSGHWTIEGARTSQFENHVRAVSALPLGSTESVANCKMVNCIGEMPKLEEVLGEGGSYHDYEKSPRENRKLGHVTYCL